MGFLSSFIGDDIQSTRLERFLDATTQSSVSQQLKSLEEPLKVPFAQAMTVLLQSRKVTTQLKQIAGKTRRSIFSSSEFAHDRVFAEVVAFYYFVLMADYFEEQDREEVGDDGSTFDSYSRSLRKSLTLANALVLKRSSEPFEQGFIILRTGGYAANADADRQSGTAALLDFVLRAWQAGPGGKAAADTSAISLPVQNAIAAVAFDEIRELCRSIYAVKNHQPVHPS